MESSAEPTPRHAPNAARRARQRLGGEAFWLLVARVLTALAGIVSLRVLTTVMPDWLYGQYALLLGYLALIAGFFVGPIAQAQNRFLHDAARDDVMRSFVVRSVLTATAAATVGGLVGAPLIWWYWPNEPWWVLIAGFAALGGIFGAVSSREQGFFNTYRWRGRFAFLSVLEAWGRLGLIVAAVLLLGATLHVLSGALALAAMLTALAGLPWLFALARESRGGGTQVRRFEFRPVWHFAFPLFGVAILSWISSLSDRYIVSRWLGDALVGRYVAGYQVAAIVPGLLGSLFFPLVSPLLYQAMAYRSDKPLKLDRYLELAALPGLFLTGMVVSDVEAVSTLLLGKRDFFSGDLVVPWVSLALLTLFVQQVLEHEAFRQKSTRGLVLANGCGAGVNVLLNVLFLRRFGLAVPALSTLCAFITSCTIVIAVYRPSVAARTWGRLAMLLVLAAAAVPIARAIVPAELPLLLRGLLRCALYGMLVGGAMFRPVCGLARWLMGAGLTGLRNTREAEGAP